MKKMLFIALILFFAMSASTFAMKADVKVERSNKVASDKIENKLSDEEIDRLMARVEVIKNMDKSEMTTVEKRELKNELKEIKTNVRNSGGTVVIGVGTLLLIILLVIILL